MSDHNNDHLKMHVAEMGVGAAAELAARGGYNPARHLHHHVGPGKAGQDLVKFGAKIAPGAVAAVASVAAPVAAVLAPVAVAAGALYLGYKVFSWLDDKF